jgi:aspartyl-tRNA(Asn)/glutamyl-tRNA(Gln) amidotransferase subunit A
VRLPASFCGVVGIKPTYGRVSRFGLVAYGSSLEQIGVIGRDVGDVAAVLAVIANHDARDSTCVDHPVPDYVTGLTEPADGMRVGVAREYFGDGLDPEVRSCVEQAIGVYREAGAVVRELSLPHIDFCIASYYVVATAEASSNLARFDGVHYGRRTSSPKDLFHLYAASRAEGFGPEVKRRIMLGTYALSSGYYDAYYLTALKVRTLIRRDFEKALAEVDVLIGPTSPVAGFRFGERVDDPLAMYLADVYTVAANLTGLPAISVPCGFNAAGVPVGLQLIGRPFFEDHLLRIAHEYQRCTDWHTKRPPIC